MRSARTSSAVIAVVALWATAGCSSSHPPATAQDVRAAAQRFVEAVSADDEAALRDLVADDAQVPTLLASNAHRRWTIDGTTEPDEAAQGYWYVETKVRSGDRRETWGIQLVDHDGTLVMDELPGAAKPTSGAVDPSAAATESPAAH